MLGEMYGLGGFLNVAMLLYGFVMNLQIGLGKKRCRRYDGKEGS